MTDATEQPASVGHARLLATDVWYMILEIVEEETRPVSDLDWDRIDLGRQSHPMLPFILVCKAWKAIATPLLYRSASYSKGTSLMKFARHLASYQSNSGSVGDLLHHFTYWSLPNKDAQSSVDLVVSSSPNLLSFIAAGILSRTMVQLADTSTLSLRSLNVTIDSKESITPVLFSIGRLKLLHRLTVKQIYRPHPEDVNGVEPPCLPQLRHLDVYISGYSSTSIMAYFYQGQYSLLQSLVLYDMEDDIEEALLHFFRSNGAYLIRIDFIDETERTLFRSLPTDSLPALTHVALVCTVWPTAQWYSRLPSSARHLHVRAYMWREDPVEFLVEHLDAEVCGSSGVPFRYIHVDDWSWSDELENWSESTRLMVGSAQRLWKMRGISLLDETGLSLESSLKPLSNCTLLDG